jgi:hypothetical protein
MWIHWATADLLNKLVFRKPWCPLSEPSYNISGGSCAGFGVGVFTSLSPGLGTPSLLGAYPPGTSGPVDPMEGLASSGMLESKSQLHKGTWRRLGNQLGVPPVRLVKNPDSNNRSAFGRRGAWSPLKDPWVTLSGVKLGFSGLGSRAKVCETPPGFSH